MPLTISDVELQAMHMDPQEARVEIACRLFDAGKLGKSRAARLAGLSRPEFEDELIARKLPIIRIDEEYWQQELESLKAWERREQDGK